VPTEKTHAKTQRRKGSEEKGTLTAQNHDVVDSLYVSSASRTRRPLAELVRARVEFSHSRHRQESRTSTFNLSLWSQPLRLCVFA
jgi:hypothetical protein